jgi:mycothiol synthase
MIFAWAAARAREAGRERGQAADLRAAARDHDRYARTLLENQGFQVVRYFYQLARPLDAPIPEPQWPAGFTLQPGPADPARWVAMHNDAFSDHWDFHPVEVETREHWLTDPNYRPDLDLIALAPDGTFAAFCYNVIDPEANAGRAQPEGLVNLLGTRPAFRRRGLAHALLLTALRRFQDAGLARAVLGVDAANPTGALRLYESVGFRPDKTDVAYYKEL